MLTNDNFERTIKMLDLEGVQVVIWDRSGTTSKQIYIFFYGMRNENHELSTRFLCIGESCEQLRGLSLLVMGFCTNTKRSLV
jgi:hypothetical protein